MGPRFAKHCIYALAHIDTLANAARRGGPAQFRESKPWVTARRLWQRSQKAGDPVAVLFADAAGDSGRLLYWGLLTGVVIDKEHGVTGYTVDQVRPMSAGHSKEDLVLVSTGKPISPRFIRSYAICHTPV